MSNSNTSNQNNSTGMTSTVIPTKKTRNRAGPKRDIAKQIYLSTNSRQEFIAGVTSVGIKPTTASSYYARLKNGNGNWC